MCTPGSRGGSGKLCTARMSGDQSRGSDHDPLSRGQPRTNAMAGVRVSKRQRGWRGGPELGKRAGSSTPVETPVPVHVFGGAWWWVGGGRPRYMYSVELGGGRPSNQGMGCGQIPCHIRVCPRGCHIRVCPRGCHIRVCPRGCHIRACPRGCHIRACPRG